MQLRIGDLGTVVICERSQLVASHQALEPHSAQVACDRLGVVCLQERLHLVVDRRQAFAYGIERASYARALQIGIQRIRAQSRAVLRRGRRFVDQRLGAHEFRARIFVGIVRGNGSSSGERRQCRSEQ